MTLSHSASYLRYVRVETRLYIALVIAIMVALFLPHSREIMSGVLVAGMFLRAWSCSVVPAPTHRFTGPVSIVMLPFWPAYVAVDSIGRWMHREGFGVNFRIVVTTVLLCSAWIALVDSLQLVPGIVILVSSALSATLKERDSPWYVLPSTIPLLFMEPLL